MNKPRSVEKYILSSPSIV